MCFLFVLFFVICVFVLFTDAKLPLYAFKKVVNEKDLALQECGEPPVAFLDSLLLGEVTMEFW